MTQARAIFRNTAFLAVARVIERASGVVLVFLVARTLGVSALGVYAAAIAFYGLFAIAGDLGASNLLVRELARDQRATARYLVHLGSIAIAASAVIVAVAWIVVPRLGIGGDVEKGFLIVTLAVVPGTLRILQEAVFVAHQRVEFQTAVTSVAALLTVCLTVVLVAMGHGVTSLLGAFVAVQWLVTISYFVLINRRIAPIRCPFKLGIAWALLKQVRAFAGLSVLAALFAQPEILILSTIGNSTQAGYYSAAIRVVMLWQVIPQTFMVNVFPVLSRAFKNKAEDFGRIPEKATKYLLALAFPLAAGIIVAAEPIVELLYGEAFGPAVSTMRVLAISIPIFSVTSVLWRVLVARDKQALVLQTLSGAVALRLAIGAVLAVSFGSIGAAIAAVAVIALYNVTLAALVRRDGVDLKIVAAGERFMLATLPMAAVAWFLIAFIELWFVIPLAAVTYAAGVWLLRAFSPEDVALFRDLRRTDPVR